MKTHRILAYLAFLFLASCTSNSSPDKSPSAVPARKSLGERMTENSGYKQDSSGNWKAQSDRRSPYESQGSTYDSKKSFKKQGYKTGDYNTKSWWGDKQYDRKSYTGNTDASRFSKASKLGEKGAREANTNAKIADNYKTSAYGTNTARESDSKQIQKGNNTEIENRRSVFPQPEIIDWKQQRSLSMDQSKKILGK